MQGKILLHDLGKPTSAMKKGSRVDRRQCDTCDTVRESIGKPRGNLAEDKNKYNQCDILRCLSEIKLKRTDTTLDLSQ